MQNQQILFQAAVYFHPINLALVYHLYVTRVQNLIKASDKSQKPASHQLSSMQHNLFFFATNILRKKIEIKM